MQALGEKHPQKLEGGRVHPVQVFDDEQDRPAGCAVCSHSSIARKISSLCRTGDKVERGISVGGGQR